jgi:hypothetical protein
LELLGRKDFKVVKVLKVIKDQLEVQDLKVLQELFLLEVI